MILVGELRDLETMSIAVTAAEMGILVMGTLHTNGAAPTVDRMVNAFPSDKQSHVRTMLSTSLRGVVSQQLLQRADQARPRRGARDPGQHAGGREPDPPGQDRPAREHACSAARSSACAPWTRPSSCCSISKVITGTEAFKKAINKAALRAVQERRPERPSGAAGSNRRHDPLRLSPHAPHPRHQRPALRQRPAALRAHPRGRADRHLGALPALRGHECVYVCADDTHGTPIMLKAQAEGITPEELIARRRRRAPRDLRRLPDRLDYFHSTHSRREPRAVRPDVSGAARCGGYIDAAHDPPGL